MKIAHIVEVESGKVLCCERKFSDLSLNFLGCTVLSEFKFERLINLTHQ